MMKGIAKALCATLLAMAGCAHMAATPPQTSAQVVDTPAVADFKSELTRSGSMIFHNLNGQIQHSEGDTDIRFLPDGTAEVIASGLGFYQCSYHVTHAGDVTFAGDVDWFQFMGPDTTKLVLEEDQRSLFLHKPGKDVWNLFAFRPILSAEQTNFRDWPISDTEAVVSFKNEIAHAGSLIFQNYDGKISGKYEIAIRFLRDGKAAIACHEEGRDFFKATYQIDRAGRITIESNAPWFPPDLTMQLVMDEKWLRLRAGDGTYGYLSFRPVALKEQSAFRMLRLRDTD